jgi:CDP-glycerol glycerophosphotransferase (TagB/SpsB family)
MLYMYKPVIYYHFDLDRYLEEHGAYIDLRTDLPGDCAVTADELLDAAERVIGGGYRIQPEYAGKLDRFYAYRDKQNCRRTYEFLRSCGR